MSTDRRTEIVSLRLTAEEKQLLVAAADRHGTSVSDWARDRLLAHVGDPYVFPSQNITVSLTPIPNVDQDVVRALRLALAAAESRAAS